MPGDARLLYVGRFVFLRLALVVLSNWRFLAVIKTGNIYFTACNKAGACGSPGASVALAVEAGSGALHQHGDQQHHLNREE